VDGFHIQGVAEDERDVVLVAEIGDPVPGEEAFDANDDVSAEGGEEIEEALWLGGDLRLADDVAGLVQDADGEQSGMEVNAAVELMLTVVESHGFLLSVCAKTSQMA
jgi:hypothetical protein